jgi:hypothetical protein
MSRIAAVAAAGVVAGLLLPNPSEVRLVLVSAIDRAGQSVLGLQPDDVAVENAGTAAEVIDVTPASYPIAIVVDTSSYARSDFQLLRDAVARFVEGLAPRPIALYTSGTPVSRVENFTPDRGRIAAALARTFAAPNSTSHPLGAVLRVLEDVPPLNAPVTAIVVLSAGAVEMNPPSAQQVLVMLRQQHAILHVVEQHAILLERASPQPGIADVFGPLSERSHGEHVRGAGASVYGFGLDAIGRQLDAESIVSYSVDPNAAYAVRVRVRVPAATVRAIPLDGKR